MPEIYRRIQTRTDAAVVFDYLTDFENAVEWDSGTRSCVRIDGDGGVGTTYRNVSSFMGREVTLEYTVEKVDAPHFVIVGRSGNTTSTDAITVTPSGTGCVVDYRAQFEFGGLTRLLTPLLIPALQRLGDKTERTLHDALEQL